MSDLSWVDEIEEKQKEERSKEYFNIQEGDNRFVMLSHCAPFAQVWDNATKTYRAAAEGDKKPSIKGICWIYQEGLIKSAMLPYTVVKAIRALQNDPEWEFEGFPWPHVINITAKNAGQKEVEYNVVPSPKEVTIPKEILEELKTKPSPEEVVEKKREKGKQAATDYKAAAYGEGAPDPDSIPF